METVAIVGVGLIGGSFAIAIRNAGFAGRILGVSSQATLRRALDLGIVDEGLPIQSALPRAGLVFLAHPISRIIDQLSHIDPLLRPGAVVTDAGSTKRRIVAAAGAILRGAFVGGHPMAGKESRGAENADAHLFRSRTWFLTPSTPELMEQPGVAALVSLIRSTGAQPVVISPDDHDRLVSLTSHLPQLLSTALSATLHDTVGERARVAAGPGLHDMTRLAMSSYDIWADILDTNQDAIAGALDAFIERLTRLRNAVQGTDAAAIALRQREFEFALNLSKALRKATP